jgi:predicted AAA+ superfamily ATPase
MIGRALTEPLRLALVGGDKVVVLYGPRQVGKTTLLETVLSRLEGRILLLNGDFVDDQARLRPERAALSRLVQGIDCLAVDEAQNVPAIGSTLKLLHDHFPGLRVIATGSSSFDLAARTGEPLTGRQRTFRLFPIAYSELAPTPLTSATILENAMLHGGYPEVLGMAEPGDRVRHLRQLVADALLKDVFAHVDVNRQKLLDILRLLALQIGAEVSLSELARTVQVDSKTVARYLDLLEATFVVVRLRGFSRNLRKEVGKSQKVYFLDLGIRNAILNTFQPLDARTDVGALWENLLIVERMKRNAYADLDATHHFWRTYDRQEIDLVEETSAGLAAFELKWGRSRQSLPRLFLTSYPEAKTAVISKEQAHEFLLADR